MSESDDTLRIDKWLWHARFYKTRGLAARAVAGGHVAVNGERVKPARAIRVGDELAIVRDRLEYRITVLELPPRRGPASAARACYEEDEASRRARETRLRQLRDDRALAPRTRGRPDRRTRRRIRGLAGKD